MNSSYETTETALVAALGLHGIQPVGMTKVDRRWVFQFEDSAYLREVVRSYIRGTLEGSLLAYSTHYKDLVSRIHRENAKLGPGVGKTFAALNAALESGK
jgi:hypothetical protein